MTMQGPDPGAVNKCSSDKNQASSINFRPSPNFKHMKKYLKFKFEEDMNSGMVAQDGSSSKMDLQKINCAVQPPLPPNSPPPDSPLGFTVKQEVEDEEYEGGEEAEEEPGSPAPPPEPAPERRVMCKDFVRGTCARGAACIFMHKLDVTQLEGVYRFCRDFENKRCLRPVCFFVHATTFEKEHFMRTGWLPPHATAHLRSVAPGAGPAAPAAPAAPAPAPAPPAPPPPHPTDVPADLSPMYANAPATALASGTGCAEAGALAARLPLDVLAALPSLAALPAPSLKRDAFSSPPRDLDSNEPLAKKCKHCDLSELRLQHAKAQVGGMLRASQELDDKLDKLSKSNARLLHLLEALMPKPWRMLDNEGYLGGGRLSAVLDGNRLSAALDGDGNKKVLLSQMKVLLTKILLGTDSLPSKSGRDLPT